MVLLPPSSHSRGTMPSTPAGEGTGAGQESSEPGTHEGHPALQCKPRGVGLPALWGISEKASSTHPGTPGAGGTDPPPPSPRGTPGTNPSHPQAVLGALCLTGGLGAEGDPAAAGLDMAATGGDRACSDTTDPGLGNRGKNLIRGCLLWQGCSTTGTAWPEPPAPEELPCPWRAGDWRCQWDYPNLWVFQGNVAAPAPATKHSPSVGLEGGTQEHPSSQMCHLWLSHCGKCSEVFAINWCQRIWMG